MVVGLGTLDIVSRLTLDVEPTFQVTQSVFEGLDWDQVLENFDEVTSAAYSASLFSNWSGAAPEQAWRHYGFFGGTPATGSRHPLPGVSGSNCTRQLGVPGPWSDRLARFRMEFTPSKGEELQSEYLIRREYVADAPPRHPQALGRRHPAPADRETLPATKPRRAPQSFLGLLSASSEPDPSRRSKLALITSLVHHRGVLSRAKLTRKTG